MIDAKKSVSQVAHELGIPSKTLGLWVTAYRNKLAGQPIPEDMPDNERMKELERRNRELEQENAFLKMASRNLTLPADAIFHSDRGSNCTSAEFAEALE